MNGDEWKFEDGVVGDDDVLLRRVPKKPEHRTFDAERGSWTVGPGALRRLPNEGMSVHRESVVISMGADPETLYDCSAYGSIGFYAKVPRGEGAGVMETPQSEEIEPDRVLRDSHADVRPPTASKDRAFWSTVAYAISQNSWWVQSPN